MREGGILISVPTFGTLDVEFASRFYSIELPLNAAVARCWPVGMPVADARNMSVKAAIERGCEYVFFVDYDVLLPPDALTALVARNTEMIGGLYFSKSKPPWPLLLVNGHSSMDWTPGELVKVDALGMGCTLLRVDLLEQLEPPWFKTGDSTERVAENEVVRSYHTEDTYFFKRVREELGVRPYVDTAVRCVHKHLTTGDRFFYDDESGLPAWSDADGEKHIVEPVDHSDCPVRDLTEEDKHEEDSCCAAGDTDAGERGDCRSDADQEGGLPGRVREHESRNVPGAVR